MLKSRFNFWVAHCLVVIISLSLIVVIQNRSVSSDVTFPNSSSEEQDKKELNLLSRFPSMGFSNLIADIIYLKFIQYFGDTPLREKVGYSLSPLYFAGIVEKDPKFIDALLRADISTSVFAGYPQASVDLLKKSLEQIPAKFLSGTAPPYYLWRAKGINELLFLGNPLATQQSYKNGIDWAKQYNDANSQNFITVTENTLNFLAKNPNSKLAQIGAWTSVLGSSPDPKTFRRVKKEIEKLGGRIIIGLDGQIKVQVPSEIE